MGTLSRHAAIMDLDRRKDKRPFWYSGKCSGYGLGTNRGISPSAALPYYPSAFDSLALAHVEDVTTSAFRLEELRVMIKSRVLPLALQ